MKISIQSWLLLSILHIAYSCPLSVACNQQQNNQYTNLAKQIDSIVVNNKQLNLGIKIYSLKNNQVIYAHNSDHLLAPASNNKIFTCLAALNNLGPDFTFDTNLLLDGPEPVNGIFNGDLYLQTSGDPSLTSQDLEQLIITGLSQKNISAIAGNIYIDKENFDNRGFAPGYCIDNLEDPEDWFVPVRSCIINHKPLGINETSHISFMKDTLLSTLFYDPVLLIQDIFTKNNIACTGSISFKTATTTCQHIHTHKSAPLHILIVQLMKPSDNLYADCLFKKIGELNSKDKGSWLSGKHALYAFLQNTVGINPPNFRIEDGSGLSRYDLCSSHEIIQLLTWASTQTFFPLFQQSLAINGVDGTLQKRMSSLPPIIFGKTGALGGVSALSGYVQAQNDMFVFSILINGYVTTNLYDPHCKINVEDAICTLLATYQEQN
jgi:D-alanyl-D-alanine carboxypeptidase/D-alanyl-D-alanine-endopeptidase (penicillin-binding protein 4)